jgi:hypothetical protein
MLTQFCDAPGGVGIRTYGFRRSRSNLGITMGSNEISEFIDVEWCLPENGDFTADRNFRG